MKKMIVVTMAVLMVLALFSGVALSAPLPQEATVTVNATVAQAVWLELSKANIVLSVDPDGTPSDSDSLTATVKSNWPWRLSVSSLALTGSAPDGSSATLPDSCMSINSLDGGGGTLATGVKTNGEPLAVDYTLSVDYLVTPAQYSGSHTYTLTFQ